MIKNLTRVCTYAFLFIAVGTFLTGCTFLKSQTQNKAAQLNPESSPSRKVYFELDSASQVLPIVFKYKEAAEKEQTTKAILDYHFVRQGAIEILSKTLENNDAPEKIKQVALGELKIIDPNNPMLQFKTSPPPIKLSKRARELAYIGILENVAQLNLAIYNNVTQEISSPELPKINSGIWTKKAFSLLFNEKLPDHPACINSTNALQCIAYFMNNSAIPLTIHSSASINQTSKEPQNFAGQKVITVIKNIVAKENVSFILFPDGIYIFKGASVPPDLSGRKSVFEISINYADVEAVALAIGAAGYSSSVTGIDPKGQHLWISATPSEYLVINQVVQSADVPTAQVHVDVEFIEVQDSFIQEIGARIPQTISAAFGTPVYRYYNYGANVTIPGDGLVSQIGNTGGTTLSNVINLKPENILRVLVNDEAFRIAARESNTLFSVTERPSIMINSGHTGEIKVGKRIPAQVRNVTANGNVIESIMQVQVGVDMKIYARVLDDSHVDMNVDMTISSYAPESYGSRGSTQPAINNRQVKSNFTVQSHNTVVLGGLISERQFINTDGVPGLAKIPFLRLFGGVDNRRVDNTGILILLTPMIKGERGQTGSSYIGPKGREAQMQFGGALQGALNLYSSTNMSSGSNNIPVSNENRGRR